LKDSEFTKQGSQTDLFAPSSTGNDFVKSLQTGQKITLKASLKGLAPINQVYPF
jgi:hypothetical protein